jgi:hypothetical protein
MFAAIIVILISILVASCSSELTMRVRLSRLERSGEKLLWWRRGGDEVAEVYQGLFPRSRLPLLRLFWFWLVVALAAAILSYTLWKSR